MPIPAAGAVPKPAPPEQVNLEAGKHEANQEMADGRGQRGAARGVERARSSSRPLADKKEAAAHADTAPGEYREQEQQVIEQGKADAAAETKEGVAGMQGAKGAALAKLVADKGKTKSKDEQKRAEVTAKVQAIFDATEADVKKILDGIDPKVEKEFEAGEKAARAKFESYVSAKMSAYKKDRYGGWTGEFRWLRDKIKGMPSKVNEFYVAGRELYLKEMDGIISRVADIVGTDLTAAKKRIATGKTEIATYVKSLPKDLQKVGAEASKEIGDRFEQLESDVDSKQESVVDTLATKYVAARKGLDERIEELQAENRGLVDKVIGAIKAIINTIRELVAMLKNVLARVAGVVGQIIKAPVRFLGNLIDGIKSGIIKFKDNFLDHLRKGLMSLAVRGARRGWRRAAGHVRPQGRHQAAGLAVRPDLAQHPQPDRQADRREGDGRGREGRRHLPEARRRRRRRAVGDAAGEARRHQGDDPRPGQGLRAHEDHHRRHHLADRPAQPGGGVHQGLQADLRRRDVLREQRQPDREVRQHRSSTRSPTSSAATSAASWPRSRTSSARWSRSSSASWPA